MVDNSIHAAILKATEMERMASSLSCTCISALETGVSTGCATVGGPGVFCDDAGGTGVGCKTVGGLVCAWSGLRKYIISIVI